MLSAFHRLIWALFLLHQYIIYQSLLFLSTLHFLGVHIPLKFMFSEQKILLFLANQPHLLFSSSLWEHTISKMPILPHFWRLFTLQGRLC